MPTHLAYARRIQAEAFVQTQPERAEAILRGFTPGSPGFAAARLQLSKVLAAMGRSEESVQLVEDTLEYDPLSAELLHALADSHRSHASVQSTVALGRIQTVARFFELRIPGPSCDAAPPLPSNASPSNALESITPAELRQPHVELMLALRPELRTQLRKNLEQRGRRGSASLPSSRVDALLQSAETVAKTLGLKQFQLAVFEAGPAGTAVQLFPDPALELEAQLFLDAEHDAELPHLDAMLLARAFAWQRLGLEALVFASDDELADWFVFLRSIALGHPTSPPVPINETRISALSRLMRELGIDNAEAWPGRENAERFARGLRDATHRVGDRASLLFAGFDEAIELL
ncbi:MAG: hypothetical protein RBU37_26340, partial [Myxococcota bacterium]|nr:hypothetical protein [Myxococcota bacterium]